MINEDGKYDWGKKGEGRKKGNQMEEDRQATNINGKFEEQAGSGDIQKKRIIWIIQLEGKQEWQAKSLSVDKRKFTVKKK
ncbi:MAG: hypothetical protein V8R41_00305 [Dorea formicigenerans]